MTTVFRFWDSIVIVKFYFWYSTNEFFLILKLYLYATITIQVRNNTGMLYSRSNQARAMLNKSKPFDPCVRREQRRNNKKLKKTNLPTTNDLFYAYMRTSVRLRSII